MMERLPAGWKEERLDEVADLERVTVEPNDIRAGTRYVSLEHVGSSGAFLNVREVEEGELASNKFAFDSRHILYGKLRPYLTKIARPDFAGVCTTEIVPIRANGKVLRDYLYHYLRQPRMVTLAISRTGGANLPRLSPTDLATFPIAYPESKDEQGRIADILDQADALRRKRAEAIRLVGELIPSVFHEMFGDPLANPKGWPIIKIETLLSQDRDGTRCGPFGTLLKKHEYTQDGVPVWGIDNVLPNLFVPDPTLFVSETKYQALTGYAVQPGDVLISRAGTVGRMCVAYPAHSQSIIGTNLVRVVLDRSTIVPEYFTTLFTTCPRIAALRASSDEGAYSFMQTETLRRLSIPLPGLGLQSRFRDRLQEARQIRTTMERSATELDNLFHSLLQRAFRGEL